MVLELIWLIQDNTSTLIVYYLLLLEQYGKTHASITTHAQNLYMVNVYVYIVVHFFKMWMKLKANDYLIVWENNVVNSLPEQWIKHQPTSGLQTVYNIGI